MVGKCYLKAVNNVIIHYMRKIILLNAVNVVNNKNRQLNKKVTNSRVLKVFNNKVTMKTSSKK